MATPLIIQSSMHYSQITHPPLIFSSALQNVNSCTVVTLQPASTLYQHWCWAILCTLNTLLCFSFGWGASFCQRMRMTTCLPAGLSVHQPASLPARCLSRIQDITIQTPYRPLPFYHPSTIQSNKSNLSYKLNSCLCLLLCSAVPLIKT